MDVIGELKEKRLMVLARGVPKDVLLKAVGAIYRIPERMVINQRNGKMFEDVPYYDAPVVITDKSLVMKEK